jgi:predicted esterase
MAAAAAPAAVLARDPVGAITQTIILLHGRDSDAATFADELFESEASSPLSSPPHHTPAHPNPQTLPALLPTTRWVFPEAGLLPSARFGQQPLRQWFDVWSVEDPAQRPDLQTDGLRRSIEAVAAVVRAECAAAPGRRKVVLGGISQGFATVAAAVVGGWLDGAGLSALVGFSSWMPFEDHIPRADGGARPSTLPVFIAHCADDAVVPVEAGRKLRDRLGEGGGVAVTWREYPSGGHWVNEPAGVDDLVAFLHSLDKGASVS